MSAPMDALSVLSAHRIECTAPGEVTCRSCRDLGWMSWRKFDEHVLEALSTAGFLATDEEWGIEFPNGMREEFSTPERARAEATVLQRANPVVVSRRVTPWRSA